MKPKKLINSVLEIAKEKYLFTERIYSIGGSLQEIKPLDGEQYKPFMAYCFVIVKENLQNIALIDKSYIDIFPDNAIDFCLRKIDQKIIEMEKVING